jgi:hypothetical protein
MLATSLLSREYIELQLRFATWISHGDAASFPQAVLVATNLFRRFRLGHPDDASTSSEWQGYVAELCGCTSLDAQVEWTSTFFAERRQLDAPPPEPAPDELVSGPFSAEVVGDALRFHFVPEIDTARSPLNASQLARRHRQVSRVVELGTVPRSPRWREGRPRSSLRRWTWSCQSDNAVAGVPDALVVGRIARRCVHRLLRRSTRP